MAGWLDRILSPVLEYGVGELVDAVTGEKPLDPFVQGALQLFTQPEKFGASLTSGRSIAGAGESSAPYGVQLGGASAEWDYSGDHLDYQEPSMPTGLMGLGNGNGIGVLGPRRMMLYSGGIIPSGYRVAQRPARRGTPSRPAGTYLVPRRSMNPLNPRALVRAERRMSSFTHWVKRHFRIAAAAPRRRKAGPARRRKTCR